MSQEKETHVHVHIHLDHEAHKLLDRIEGKIDVALTKLEILMALADDLKAGIAELDAETNAIATLLTSLGSRIKNSMTDQEVADIKAALKAESDRLKTLAVDPTAPVPPVPPALSTLRKKNP